MADLCPRNSIAFISWRFRVCAAGIPSGRGSDVGRVGGRVVSACLASFRHFRLNTKYEKYRNTIYDKSLEMLLKRRARASIVPFAELLVERILNAIRWAHPRASPDPMLV